MPDKNNSNSYLIRCDITPGEWTTEEILKEKTHNPNYGYADAFIICGITTSKNEIKNFDILTLDGRTEKPVSNMDFFDCFHKLVTLLRYRKDLPLIHKMICEETLRMIEHFIPNEKNK